MTYKHPDGKPLVVHIGYYIDDQDFFITTYINWDKEEDKFAREVFENFVDKTLKFTKNMLSDREIIVL